MDILHNLAFGFGHAMTWQNLMFCALGCTVGTLIGLLPGVASVQIPPDVVGLLVLPPLLFAAATDVAVKELLGVLRPVLLLAIGLVAFTAAAVAASDSWVWMAADWYSVAAETLLPEYLSPASGGNEPMPDAIVVNAAFTATLSYVTPRTTSQLVRIINSQQGTAARTRVLITSTDGKKSWGTVGVSDNIIDASWEALREAVEYKLMSPPMAAKSA